MQTASRIPSRPIFPLQCNNLITLESENIQEHPLKLPFDFQEHKNFENEFRMEKKSEPVSPRHTENSFISNQNPITENTWRIVREFVSNLKEKTSFYRFAEYEHSIQKYLRDNIFFSRQEISKKKETFSRLDQKILRYILSVFFICLDKLNLKKKIARIWNPYEPLKLLWDITFFVIITIEFYSIPIEISFDASVSNMEEVIVISFFANTLISLNTAYYFRGSLVITRKDIVRNYAKKYLLNDFLTIFVYLLFFFLNGDNTEFLHFFKLVFYLNTKRFFNIRSVLDEKFKLYYRFHGYFEIFELITFSFFIIHVFACGFFYISLQSSYMGIPTWISKENINLNDWQVAYATAFYWATITIMTVGYGDVVPINSIERIYAILTAIMGCGVFAFNVSMIGRICEKMYKDNEQFKENNNVITHYMDKKKINESVQLKIKAYLRYYWKEALLQNDQREREVIDKLTKSLRAELIYEANSKILYGLPLFYSNFSERSIRRSIPLLKEMRYSPGDVIFEENEKDEQEIYLLNKGKIDVFYRKDNGEMIFIDSYIKGFFGEYSFFTGFPRNTFVKSGDFTTLFSLKRSDFLSIIKDESDDYYRFCMLRDEILTNNSNYQQRKPCICCRKFGHRIEVCPLIHYIPNKESIIKIYSKRNVQQLRATHLRSRMRKINARRNNKDNFQRLCQYIRDSRKSIQGDEEQDEILIVGDDPIERFLFNPNRFKSSSSNNISFSAQNHNNTINSENKIMSEQYESIENFENIKKFKTYYPYHNFTVEGFNYLVERVREMKEKGLSSIRKKSFTVKTANESGSRKMRDENTTRNSKKGKKITITAKKKNFYSSRLELKEKVSLYELVKLVMETPKIKKQLEKKG